MVRWLMIWRTMRIVRIRIPPSPIVWIVPTPIPRPRQAVAIWIIPIVERIVPTIVPAIRWHSHCAPRAKHRGDILRFNPNHIARYHHIVESRVVGRSIKECIGVAQRVVRRRHTIGWRRKTIQTTSISTLVGVGQNSIVAIEVLSIRDCNTLRCSLGLNARQGGVVLRLLRLVLSLGKLGLRLLTLGDGYLVVYGVQIVRIRNTLPRCCTARQEQNLHRNYGYYCKSFHSYIVYLYTKRMKWVV